MTAQEIRTPLAFLRNRRPLVRQTETAECGLACLAMVASWHGLDIDLFALRRKFAISSRGITLRALLKFARDLHLSGRALRVEPEHLQEVRFPAIAHWGTSHFVVIDRVTRSHILVRDPALGKRRVTQKEFSDYFTGVVVEFEPTSEFRQDRARTNFGIHQLWSRSSGLARSISLILLLSFFLQIFLMACPLYAQVVFDQIVADHDKQLIFVAALIFLMFCLANSALAMLRSQLLLATGSTLGYSIVVNLFHHLLKLPQEFFDKRQLGDIVSRFGSVEPVRRTLIEGLVAAALDGFMASATLILIFVYSAPLGVITVLAVFTYGLVRAATFRSLHEASEAGVIARAVENSRILETIKGISAIKIHNQEAERQNIWQNQFAKVVGADFFTNLIKARLEALNLLLGNVDFGISVAYMGASVIDGTFSIGMAIAVLTYKKMCSDRMTSLVDKAAEFRMLRLYLERIADVALSEPEFGPDHHIRAIPLHDSLQLENLCFKYGDEEPWTLSEVNLKIHAGESVAITGPSGCGKTTLVKILLGLLHPQRGRIIVDGQELTKSHLKAFRSRVGAVMQDDDLFSGSIANNIAFFDPEIDFDKVVTAAKTACIHDDIRAMPMAYETLLGEAGTSISGGQKQRLLLARALYKEPDILILDEGTAHLDVDLERRVNQSVRELGMTRIIVAHRPETIKSADRVVTFIAPGLVAQHLADGIQGRVLTDRLQQ